MKKSVGVLILTYNGLNHLPNLFDGLKKSTIPLEILCIDSSSTDGTLQYLKENEIKFQVIAKKDFNHGATREFGRKLLKTDIVVMMTQDVKIIDGKSIERLIQPILNKQAAVTYGRQIPIDGASIFETFPRNFNYPESSETRSILDVNKYGVQTFFCSDSFSAYSQEALNKVGGFPKILTHEDYYVTAKLLKAGYNICYVADAVIEHSHNYGIVKEFRRYFDAGYVRAENPWVDKIVGQAEKRGIDYAFKLIKLVAKQSIFLLPYTFLLILTKWIGFRIGFLSFKLPPSICKYFSSEKSYWTSEYYSCKKIYE